MSGLQLQTNFEQAERLKHHGIMPSPGVSELTSLESVDDEAILANTRERYESGHIYTRSGRMILVVNPYRSLPLYTPEVLELYKDSLQPQMEMPPHVFGVAASAHLDLMQNMMNQVRASCRHRSIRHRPLAAAGSDATERESCSGGGPA